MSQALTIVLVLGGLIFFHELGHFAFARLFGVGVKTFSLGFGPKLLRFRRGKTDYALSAIPLGGYVSMVGETPEDDLAEGFTPEESFVNKPAWQRMCVVAAGPIANLLLAFFIFWGLLWSQGQVALAPEVGKVRAESPAAVAGLQSGDVITSIAGKPVTYWDHVAEFIAESGGKEIAFTVTRDGNEVKLLATPERNVRQNIFGEEEETFLVGITASRKTISIPLNGDSAASAALEHTWKIISLTGQGFVKLFERKVPLDSVGGPIMIGKIISDQAAIGITAVLSITAFISINLGLLNLLPIPVLDGGHLVFLLAEMIFRKPVSPRIQDITGRIGLTLLLMLMLLTTFNDVKNWLLGTW